MKIKSIILTMFASVMLCSCGNNSTISNRVEDKVLQTNEHLKVYDYGTEVFDCYYYSYYPDSYWRATGSTDYHLFEACYSIDLTLSIKTFEIKFTGSSSDVTYSYKSAGLSYSIKTVNRK